MEPLGSRWERHFHELGPIHPNDIVSADRGLPPMKERYAMTKRAVQRSDLKVVPAPLNESLYVGIDIGKNRHVAGFLSQTLLSRHERFEACPALVFENSREGFRLLIERICSLAPLEHLFVL